MSNKPGIEKKLPSENGPDLTVEQIAGYLRNHRDFFISQEELLADLSLPHESGNAISLLERQVTILRDRGKNTRSKLGNLLDNARNNDQLFEITRELVLALLRARDINEIIQVTEDILGTQENIDACEVILINNSHTNIPESIRTEDESKLIKDFGDVFRLKRTYCGHLSPDQLIYLFGDSKKNIKSTAICPLMGHSKVLGLLALGNNTENYFNINLDTLFVDYIGNVVGAVLGKEIK